MRLGCGTRIAMPRGFRRVSIIRESCMKLHHRRVLANLCVILSIACIAAAHGAELDRSGLEKALAAKMEQLRVPGMVVYVYQHDKPVVEFALGLADVENNKPMSKNLHFRVASISKP